MSGPCPSAERLAAALRGTQPGAADAELAAHVAECPACQARLEQLAGGSGWLETKARTHTASASGTSERLRQAMQALESQVGEVHAETPAPPKLDFLQPSNQADALGRFGSYDVIAHVASGGMGIVLKARDPALDRVVALKILPPSLAANALARSRFIREARAAAAVVHEHVVPIHAVDECRGLPYLVMQFVEGRPLSERIRTTGPLQLEEILRIGAQAAAGLAAAHARGLVHRDIKPSNILLENSVERVKLTDFGLARAVDDAGLTRTGELAGTPEFMSPEQASNEAVDHRSDLFSLGSVLYAMCTGVSPFQATTVIAAVRKVCDARPPPVHELNSAIPRWLSHIVARLMAKSPDERFQSAREVGELLQNYLARAQHGELSALPEHSPTTEPNRGRWKLAATVGVVVLMGVAALIFALKGRRSSSPDNSMQPASQSAFIVRNEAGKSLGEFSDVDEALRAAQSGGVIELRWNGPREIPPVTLPARGLTLRAATGFRPVWVNTNLAISAIRANAALIVENIELALRVDTTSSPGGSRVRPGLGPSGVGLIVISNAPLRVSHCMLQLPNPRLQPRTSPLAAARLAVIVLDDRATCNVENSALVGESWTAILWRQTGKSAATDMTGGSEVGLSLTNCLVTAFRGIWVESPQNVQTRLQMVRNTFRVVHFLHFPPTAVAGSMSVLAQTNLFSTAIVILDGRTTEREVLTAYMRWQGSGNLFSLFNAEAGRPEGYVVLKNVPGSATLAQWNQWWSEPETGSRQADVTFAGDADFKITGVRVTDGGPPLSREQWSRFGADTAKMVPASR